MLKIISKVFNESHVIAVEKISKKSFPDEIEGIKCNHCGKTYTYNAYKMIDHLQNDHNLKIKEILSGLKSN